MVRYSAAMRLVRIETDYNLIKIPCSMKHTPISRWNFLKNLGIVGAGTLLVASVNIVALCDIYKPSIEKALALAPNVKVYGDYREVLEDKSIDAVLVAAPLSLHCKIVFMQVCFAY